MHLQLCELPSVSVLVMYSMLRFLRNESGIADISRQRACLWCACPTRLVPGWDVLCVEQLAAAQQCSPTGKAVLSTYPLGYTGEGAAASVPEDAPATLLCASRFDQQGMLRTAGR